MLVKLPDVIEALKEKRYLIFDDPFELNIVGIRSADMTPNIFNDKLIAFWKTEDPTGEFEHKIWDITTDPGLYYLNDPMNINGTAILFPGQYVNCYALDLHRGKYLALCQRLDKVKVYRDANKNNRYDPDEIECGMFGINIHKAGVDSARVDKWSAGCQVFQREEDFNQFIELCQTHRVIHGNKFTYTLITEVDLIKTPQEVK
jgi:hypothetical protein